MNVAPGIGCAVPWYGQKVSKSQDQLRGDIRFSIHFRLQVNLQTELWVFEFWIALSCHMTSRHRNDDTWTCQLHIFSKDSLSGALRAWFPYAPFRLSPKPQWLRLWTDLSIANAGVNCWPWLDFHPGFSAWEWKAEFARCATVKIVSGWSDIQPFRIPTIRDPNIVGSHSFLGPGDHLRMWLKHLIPVALQNS